MALRGSVSPHIVTPGVLFQLVRDGEAASRAELARTTGLARPTGPARGDGRPGGGAVLALGVWGEGGGGPSPGGRPPTRLAFDAASGVVLCADLGATHCRLAVSDLECTVLASMPAEMALAPGPEVR